MNDEAMDAIVSDAVRVHDRVMMESMMREP